MNSFLKKYAGFLLLVIGILGTVTINVLSPDDDFDMNPDPFNQENITTTQSQGENVFVDVKGAVLYPGVYQVGHLSRIVDVVFMAGGLAIDADVSQINLAKQVYDQMVIFVPTIDEVNGNDNQLIMVEIKGEVLCPGVYQMKSDDRVIDLIHQAGGFTTKSDSSNLMLAQVLLDGSTIIVDTKAETYQLPSQIKVSIFGEVNQPGEYLMNEGDTLEDLLLKCKGFTIYANTTNLIMDMPLYANFSIVIQKQGLQDIEEEQTDKININRANLEELMTLKGIGLILGQRIIDYRAEYGDFVSIEDIMNVSGIKESVYEQIKNDISV